MPIENQFNQHELGPSPEQLRKKLRDQNYLPTRAEITKAFKSNDIFNKEWRAFCYDTDNPVFEFLNVEFITAFSNYLALQIIALGGTEESPLTVLEVGAGNGRLSYFLQKQLETMFPGIFKLIATDSGKWNLESHLPVEILDHKQALEKYKPKIVIFSWMPYKMDVTDDFRATESVEEYILIGETDHGCCGDEWATWGSLYASDIGVPKNTLPPYIADGFEREDLEDISDHQICRTDEPGYYQHSKTTSFRRIRSDPKTTIDSV